MKTIVLCFVALFAGALAAPRFLEESDIESSSDDKIVGGNATTIEQYPHQLSLRSRIGHNCGGSVLTTTRGMTAAHCLVATVPPTQYTIKAGSTFRLDQGDPNAQIRTLSRFIIHPEWNRPTIQNDIALLQWTQPLIFGKNVQPVVLPPANYAVPYGKIGLVSGWGITREGAFSLTLVLQAVQAPFVDNVNCNRSYPGSITADMICAGFPRGGRATCQGDSGGPLVHRLGNRTVQIGIVSWARGCARPNAPTVYARVPYFARWIRENL